jgi:hypothetical protein
MDLASYWVIGFSGARRLSQPEAVRAQIAKALLELREIADGELVTISSAAIGADLLFVEEALRLDMPWIAVLPFPEDHFFNERDFPDASERERARQKIVGAADREIIRTPRDRDEAAESRWRHSAFAGAGFRCVDECDVFIAVIEEAKTGKPGGTAEVVDYARIRGRPILLIDPETQQIKRENWPRALHDELTNELRRLKHVTLKPEERAKYPTPSALAVAEWRSSFAAPARKHKFQIRWANSAVVILNAMAALITAFVFLLFHPLSPSGEYAPSPWIRGLDVMAFLCVASALGFLVWVYWKRPQARHADNRFAAEIGRSLLAVWSIPGAAERMLRTSPAKFAHLVRSLVLQYRFDPDRLRERSGTTLSESQVSELARNYAEARVQDQINHYLPRYEKARRLSVALERSTMLFSIIAFLSAFFLAYLAVFTPPVNELARSVSGMIKLLAAIGTPVAVSMLAILEAKRREARYSEMCHTLRDYKNRIAQARTLSTLQALVVDVEHLFLSENYEWWILAKENVAA